MERKAYRRELLKYRRPVRWLALALLLSGVALWFWAIFWGGPWYLAKFQTVNISWTLIGLGLIAVIYVIIARTRYHARRMAELGE